MTNTVTQQKNGKGKSKEVASPNADAVADNFGIHHSLHLNHLTRLVAVEDRG